MATSSIVEIFPSEILQLVLKESGQENPKQYARLRLVCKDINDIVEPHACSTIVIHIALGKLDIINEMLSTLVLGTGPYARWANRLVLRTSATERENRKHKLCIPQLLVPSIKALANVEVARADLRFFGEAVYDVACALSELPRLRSVDFTMSKGRTRIPLEKFSNLHAIKLGDLYPVPSSLDGVKTMIAGSPALVDLDISLGYDERGRPFEFTALVEDAMRSLTFTPTLKKLKVNQDGVSLTLAPPCVPFLHALTHLKIYGDVTVPAPFWMALQQSGIWLRSLKFLYVDQPLIDYLASYSGIEILDMDGTLCENIEGESLSGQVSSVILPKHKDTLQSFTLDNHNEVGPWCQCITNLYLENICLCRNLVRLQLVYYFPSANETVIRQIVPLVDLFSSLAQSLPRLRELHLHFVRQFRSTFDEGSSMSRRVYRRSIYRFFGYSITKATFLSPTVVPRFTVFDFHGRFSAVPMVDDQGAIVPGRYRFKLLRGSYGLDESEIVEDCPS